MTPDSVTSEAKEARVLIDEIAKQVAEQYGAFRAFSCELGKVLDGRPPIFGVTAMADAMSMILADMEDKADRRILIVAFIQMVNQMVHVREHDIGEPKGNA